MSSPVGPSTPLAFQNGMRRKGILSKSFFERPQSSESKDSFGSDSPSEYGGSYVRRRPEQQTRADMPAGLQYNQCAVESCEDSFYQGLLSQLQYDMTHQEGGRDIPRRAVSFT